MQGIQKAREVGFIDVRNGVWNFDLEEYEHYEQVENGDMNWILPGKLMAFSGPAARSTDYVGFRAMVPEDYWEVFKKRGITTVVRLNKKVNSSPEHDGSELESMPLLALETSLERLLLRASANDQADVL